MSDMSRKILVVGLQPHDAGKTTLCKALIHGFKKAGVTLVPFKPHSGISYWSQFDAFQRSLTMSTLISSDIMELEATAQSQIPMEVLNPVNRLSGPVLDRGIPEEKLVFQEFMVERFTYHDGLAHKNGYYSNGNVNLAHLRDMQVFYLGIKRNAQKTSFIRRFEDLVEAYSKNFDKATSSCYRHVKNKSLLVESFNDAGEESEVLRNDLHAFAIPEYNSRVWHLEVQSSEQIQFGQSLGCYLVVMKSCYH